MDEQPTLVPPVDEDPLPLPPLEGRAEEEQHDTVGTEGESSLGMGGEVEGRGGQGSPIELDEVGELGKTAAGDGTGNGKEEEEGGETILSEEDKELHSLGSVEETDAGQASMSSSEAQSEASQDTMADKVELKSDSRDAQDSESDDDLGDSGSKDNGSELDSRKEKDMQESEGPAEPVTDAGVQTQELETGSTRETALEGAGDPNDGEGADSAFHGAQEQKANIESADNAKKASESGEVERVGGDEGRTGSQEGVVGGGDRSELEGGGVAGDGPKDIKPRGSELDTVEGGGAGEEEGVAGGVAKEEEGAAGGEAETKPTSQLGSELHGELDMSEQVGVAGGGGVEEEEEDDQVLTFEEFKLKMQEQAEAEGQAQPRSQDELGVAAPQKKTALTNYASFDCGAKVIETNPEAQVSQWDLAPRVSCCLL